MKTPDMIKIDDVEYVRKGVQTLPSAGPEVLIRTNTAGVHIGTLKSRNGNEAVLTNARRLWSWSGAFTLNAVATRGVTRKNSRISTAVPEITLLGVIEVLPICEGVDLSSTEK